MSYFDYLNSKKIHTLGDLIDKLQALPRDAKLVGRDRDCSGYDMNEQPHIEIIFNVSANKITFGNIEYEAWMAHEKHHITQNQLKQLIEI